MAVICAAMWASDAANKFMIGLLFTPDARNVTASWHAIVFPPPGAIVAARFILSYVAACIVIAWITTKRGNHHGPKSN